MYSPHNIHTPNSIDLCFVCIFAYINEYILEHLLYNLKVLYVRSLPAKALYKACDIFMYISEVTGKLFLLAPTPLYEQNWFENSAYSCKVRMYTYYI